MSAKRKVALLLAAATAALSLVATASAGTWGWQGWIGLSRANGNCTPWYPGQSACPPNYTYWTQINATWQANDMDLAGFENYSEIRGVYIYGGNVSVIVTPGQLSMGGVVLPQVTWCSWGGPCGQQTYTNSYVWFQATY